MRSVCWNDLSVHGPDEILDRLADAVGGPDGSPFSLQALFQGATAASRQLVAPHDAGLLETGLVDWRRDYWDTSAEILGTVECGRAPGQLVYCFDTVDRPPDQWLLAVAGVWPTLTFVLRYLDPGSCSGGVLTAHGAAPLRHEVPVTAAERIAFARDHFEYVVALDDLRPAGRPRRRRHDCNGDMRPALRLVR
jgi:hypothetical protein